MCARHDGVVNSGRAISAAEMPPDDSGTLPCVKIAHHGAVGERGMQRENKSR